MSFLTKFRKGVELKPLTYTNQIFPRLPLEVGFQRETNENAGRGSEKRKQWTKLSYNKNPILRIYAFNARETTKSSHLQDVKDRLVGGFFLHTQIKIRSAKCLVNGGQRSLKRFVLLIAK